MKVSNLHPKKHGTTDCSGLRSAVFVSPCVRGLGSQGSPGQVHPGVCGSTGPWKIGFCDAQLVGRAAPLRAGLAVEDLALWLPSSAAFDPQTGSRLPGPAAVALAQWNDRARSQ